MATLDGYKAMVCGSTQGIGNACANELARLGAAVTLVARDPDRLELARRALPTSDGQVHDTLRADFTEWPVLREAVCAHVDSAGPYHVLVNNTGGPPAGPAVEATPEQFLAAFAQHLVCNQVLVQAVVDGMKSEGFGRIINIISTSVITPIRGIGVSNTIRGAVANWARTLATELAPHGITVNNLLPGYTDTARLNSLFEALGSRAGTTVEAQRQATFEKVPAGRFAEPPEIGSVAGFLASPAASYVNGVNLPVDGGKLAWQ